MRETTNVESGTQLLHRIAFLAGKTPVIICDEGGDLLGINPAAEALFGITSSGIRGTHVGRLLPQYPAACAYGVSQRGSFECRVEKSSVKLTQRTVYVLAIHQDGATERAANAAASTDIVPIERAQQKMAILRGLNNDFEAALDAIENVDVEQDPDATAPASAPASGSKLFDTLEVESRRARDAVAAMLDLCGLDFSNVPAAPTSVDLERVLQQAIKQTAALAMSRELTVMYRLDPQAPMFCLTDDDRISKSLCTVLSHALYRTTRGYVTLEAKAKRIETQHASRHGKLELEITVRDTSAGASTEELATWRRFPKYEGLQVTRHRIGLFGAHLAMEHLGGALELDSEVNIGTSYSLRFAAAAAPGQEPSWRGQQAELIGCPISIVDPGIGTSGLLRKVLREWGAKATVHASVQAAVAAANAQPDAIIITSLIGKPLAELLANVRDKCRHVVVAAHSPAASWKPMVDAAVQKGAQIAILPAPFRLQGLLQQIAAPTIVQAASTVPHVARQSKPAGAPKPSRSATAEVAKKLAAVATQKTTGSTTDTQAERPTGEWEEVATIARRRKKPPTVRQR